MSIFIPGLTTVAIPESITVHLGAPDQPAANVTVPYIDYIKNVASSELYPTWPESALRANIYAINSIALNRVFTEWYRSKGYDFDITNTTQFDQAYVHNRGIFDNISRIVDQIFDEYIIRQGQIQPLYATYCDGRVAQCNGLYQWGTVGLAEQGYVPYDILTYYYGNDINIATDTPIAGAGETFPGDLDLGDSGPYVFFIQTALNTISVNYPAIPKINPVDGIFNTPTESAVKKFQEIFGLPVTGVVDKGTWYKIRQIYSAVRKLAELSSVGILAGELPERLPLEGGAVVPRIQIVQYFINVLSAYYSSIPPVDIDGIMGPATRSAIIEYQKTMGLPVTGMLDDETWLSMYNNIVGILTTIPPSAIALPALIYPNIVYSLGSEGPGVYLIQQYLAFISTILTDIPAVTPDGVFGESTKAAVIAFQKQFNLTPDGIVGRETWNKIVDVYRDLRFGERRTAGQFPGGEIGGA
ncbi:MAG: peptidoglycan-binding protein [Tissierellia bacterium]|nr:peptidoglycan-binding protein [Tissierellia bacterium]